MDSPEWISSTKAAAMLGIQHRTLYRMIDRGEIPAYRFGRHIRLRHVEVEAAIEAMRIAPGSLGHGDTPEPEDASTS